MPNDKPPRQQAPATGASGYGYGIVRETQTLPNGELMSLWRAQATRQGKKIQRTFFDQVYGSQDIALALAMSWHDVLLRLIPPLTKRQFQTRPYRNNISGVSGVYPHRIHDEIVAWVAALETPERRYRKTFSIRNHGEQRALELAIAERKRLLDLYRSGVCTLDGAQATQEATQHFGHLPDNPQPEIAPAQSSALVDVLDHWFDQLRPDRFGVYLNVYFINRGAAYFTPVAYLDIVSTGARRRNAKKNVSLKTHKYTQRLPELWQFLQKTLTAWYGPQRWQAFAARHRDAFMSSTAQTGFQSRDYSPPPGYPQCRQPPATLLP
ncbi:MAG: hypothetical protein LBH31_08940, partial [Burkholderiaceae bacterium]|nr:hypothetical protein [Burkholderiaceae bacterium]